MNQLNIDHYKCNRCGACEFTLKNLHEKAVDGRLFVSDTNLRKHSAEITTAIVSCKNDALYLSLAL
jgi:ferredoxin